MTELARRSSPQAPSVLVEPGAHAAAGGVAVMRVHARNLAPQPRDLRVLVIGLEESWRPSPVDVLDVEADATVTVELTLTPAPGTAPGDYACVVVVESTGREPGTDAPSRTVIDVELRVDGASELVLSVEPADLRGIRRKRIEVVVGNTGNRPAHVTLDATADDGLEILLDEPLLALAPAETARVAGSVRARQVRVAGSRRRYAFGVVATGGAAPQRAQGSFTVRAVLGDAAMRLTAVVAVLALWITAVVIALPRVADRLDQEPLAREAVSIGETGPGAGGTAGGADDGGGGDAGAGGGGAGEEDGDAAGAAADSVRVAGVISGADPAGARIEVVPTSSLWSTTTGPTAGPSTTAAPGKVAGGAMPMERETAPRRLSTTANTSGVWALSGLSASARYLVTVSKPGFGTQRVVMTGAQLAAAPLETDLRAGDGSMSGLVTGPDGPVGGVELTLTDGTTTLTTRSATDGDVGRWRVDGLVTPSTYLVTAGSDLLGTQSRLVTLPAAGSAVADLTLDSGVAVISGQVVGTDSLGGVGGLGGITVRATDGTTSRTATTLTGDAAGRFLLPGLPVPATYEVTFSGVGFATVTREITLGPEGMSDWRISLTSAGGSVTGTVTDDRGTGIAAAGLTLRSGVDAAATYKTMSASDGSGTFRFAGVDPGTYVLEAEAFGHTTTYAEVVVRAGSGVEVDLTLDRIPGDGLIATASIVGRVSDAGTGGQITCPVLEPGQDCVVTATVVAEDVDGVSRTYTSTAEPDEPYRLPAPGSGGGLLPGRYVVELTAPGYEAGRVTVTVPMGAEAEAATVALRPSPSLVGSVLARTGVLGSGICVVARAVSETEPIDDPCDPEELQCRTATSRCALVSDNTYRMERLQAGEYVVTVVGIPSDYRTPEPERVTLVVGDTRRHDVIVEKLGVISVTPLSPGVGQSVGPADPNHWVRVELDGDVVASAQVGSAVNGVLQFTGLEPGTYEVIGSTDEGSNATASRSVTIGLNQEIGVQLVLASLVQAADVTIAYRYSAAREDPVPFARVTVSGVVGYNGTIPQYRDKLYTAGSDGSLRICTTADLPNCDADDVIPLVEGTVSVVVTAPGFADLVQNGVQLDSLSRLLVEPSGRTFDGRVRLLGAGGDPAAVTFTVEEAPPGTSGVTLSAGADGVVSFRDAAQPSAGSIRPGYYRVLASLPGFAAATVEIDVERLADGVPQVIDQVTWTLRQNARIGVVPVEGLGGDGVLGAQVTLRGGPDGVDLTRVAEPGQPVVDFGTHPSGDYEVDVRVAGYEFVTGRPVTIQPGAVLQEPTQVVVTRLGAITGEVVSVLGPDMTRQLPGATVTAEHQGGDGTFDATAGGGGEYRITGTRELAGLRGGTWELDVTADQHGPVPDDVVDAWPPPGPAPVESALVDVTAGSESTAPPLGLTPNPANLFLRVTDGPDHIPGLRVQMVYENTVIEPCQDGPGCQTDDEQYHFRGLLPLTYTLFISGGGYQGISTAVPVTAGASLNLTVPITTPGGSIQGEVLRTLPDGSTVPVSSDADDVRLRLLLDGTQVAEVTEFDQGSFAFEGLDGGTYSLVLGRRSGDTWTDLPARTVRVLPGQSSVLTLTLPLISRSVRVVASSTNGTDLTGALVTLLGEIDGEPVTWGPQPLGRGASGYAATFAQVPAGEWRAVVSGPAGHYGTYRGPTLAVAADSPATVTTTVEVAETELRLQVTSPTGPQTPPSSVVVTIDPTGTGGGPDENVEIDELEVTLIPGSSDTVVHLPALGYALTVEAPGAADRWQVAIAPTTVAAGTARLLARVTLTPQPVATTTTATADPDEVTEGAGDPVDVEVAVTATDDSGTVTGTVQLQHRPPGATTWTTLATSTLADGATTFQVDVSGWVVGSHSVRATFAASTGWLASTSSPTTVVVVAAEEEPDPDDEDPDAEAPGEDDPGGDDPGGADPGDDGAAGG